MARTKSKNKNKKPQASQDAANNPVETKQRSKPPAIVRAWKDYFGTGDLSDWNRLMGDLGFVEPAFTSKRKCRKALKGVWVNIADFLVAVEENLPAYRFRNEEELSHYTVSTGKIYPRGDIQKGSPLRSLMAHIFHPKRHRQQGHGDGLGQLANTLAGTHI